MYSGSNEPNPKLRHKQKNGRISRGTLVIFVRRSDHWIKIFEWPYLSQKRRYRALAHRYG